MPVSQTSILSFYKLDPAKMNAHQTLIYNIIKEDPTLCNRDIARITGMEICSVTGRVNELAKMGRIVSWSVKKDIVTQRTVKVWKAVA